MVYIAVTTYAKTPSGLLYSPDLFDTATGAFPKSPPPAKPWTYPKDGNGVIPYFDHAEVDSGTSITGVLTTNGPVSNTEYDPNSTDWTKIDTTYTTTRTWNFRELTTEERAALTLRMTFNAEEGHAKYTVPGGYDSNGSYYFDMRLEASSILAIEYLNASEGWSLCTPPSTGGDTTTGSRSWANSSLSIPAAIMSATPAIRVTTVDRDIDQRSWAVPLPPAETVSVSVAATFQAASAPVIS